MQSSRSNYSIIVATAARGLRLAGTLGRPTVAAFACVAGSLASDLKERYRRHGRSLAPHTPQRRTPLALWLQRQTSAEGWRGEGPREERRGARSRDRAPQAGTRRDRTPRP